MDPLCHPARADQQQRYVHFDSPTESRNCYLRMDPHDDPARADPRPQDVH